MLEQLPAIGLLMDFYGTLLPERQREFLRLYREENWSLAEIAAVFQLSRQGVHDGIKKGEQALKTYEEKLGLVQAYRRREKLFIKLQSAVADLGKTGLAGEQERMLEAIASAADTLEKDYGF